MRGAIAAGHPLTAEVGAAVLTEGGNAVDACVAAGFASWVVESPLTGPGGGGFMLVHRARDRTTRLLDFFAAVPGLGRAPKEAAEMESIDVDFDRETAQVFHIGPASCAVPGNAAGLEAAHRSYGSLPWPELVAPAIELARTGFPLTRQQAYLHAILDVILRHTPEGRRVYRRRAAGERLRLPDLAGSLERIAAGGARELYEGELGRALVAHLRDSGGVVSSADLRAYRVIRRRPLAVRFRRREVLTNPPPSSGGVLIAYGLRLLDRLPHEPAGSAEALAQLAEVMREQSTVRQRRFAGDLYRGGLPGRLLSDQAVRRALARVQAVSSTTHVSVVDGEGNAASLSASAGSGSGVIVPGTGIHLNNMLGEYDLRGPARAGARLTSMMAPSLVVERGRPRLVVGSAGSVRLRGAILQAIVNVLDHGLGVEEAITAPRVHLEEQELHCEGGAEPAELDRLEAMGYRLVRWRRRNLYFGGVSAVELRRDGSLAAAGDPRRGGHGVVVG
ncbi:MAG TPA: gamma-glutamyltransferase [Gaiellaceae bacterium]|nr:gamma-glutamyltransferase [Gaiellaceae bacterium]